MFGSDKMKLDAVANSENFVPQKVFFTIVAWNYISYAATLMSSVKNCHPESNRYIIVCGRSENRPDLKVDADILYSDHVDIPGIEEMMFVYDVMEYSTAVKPYAFLYFLKKYPDAHVLYTDPDLYLLKPLEHVFDALSSGSGLVLTPHMMRPLQDGKEPSDLTIMKSGIYNLGFLAARLEEEALLFIKWWADRCRRDAIVDIADNKFTDQRWVDLAPAFVGSAFILRHPGYNIAYWNLASRKIEKRDGRYTSNGQDVYFLHFSGVVPSDNKIISKHQNRFKAQDLPLFMELVSSYLSEIKHFEWEKTTKIRYEFNSFNDGRQINKFARASFRRHEGREKLSGKEAFADSDIFDGNEKSLDADGFPYVTRVMYELWHARIDLRQAFNINQASGRTDYIKWFVGTGAKEASFDEISISAAKKNLEKQNINISNRVDFQPWKPLIDKIIPMSKNEFESWLAAPVHLQIPLGAGGVYIPNILALLWESRADLAAHFKLQDYPSLESFVVWFITDGVIEKNSPIQLIGPHLAAYFGGAENGKRDILLPPKTRLMRLLNGVCEREAGGILSTIVDDNICDLMLLLWISGRARAKYNWPISMFQPLVDWLRLPSPYACNEVWIPNLVYACYLLRPDIQALFKIWTEEEALNLLAWYIVYASDEYRFSPDLLPSDFLDWLVQPCSRKKLLINIEYLIWLARPDLMSEYDLNSEHSEIELKDWLNREGKSSASISVWLEHFGLIETQKAEVIQCDLCLTGLWGVSSGRGEDIRMTAECLREHGVEFILFDCRKNLFFSADGSLIEADPSAVRINIVHLNADTALFDYINLYNAGLSKAYNIGYWAWELERLPEKWNFAYMVYDEVWASTHFTERAFARNKARPVFFMPMAVDKPKLELACSRSEFGLCDDDFVFYYGFDFNSYISRKNPEAAIKAFLKAFSGTQQKVKLILKTLSAENNSEHYKAIQSLVEKDKRIILLNRELDRSSLYSLIGLCDAYVSPHRSEGFGRGPMEAMLLGVPVIATNYSGNVDFTTHKTALVVDYDLIPVEAGDYPGGDGQFWADINIEKLAEAMSYLADTPAACLHLSDAGKQFISDRYNTKAIGLNYIARINKLTCDIKENKKISLEEKGIKSLLKLIKKIN